VADNALALRVAAWCGVTDPALVRAIGEARPGARLQPAEYEDLPWDMPAASRALRRYVGMVGRGFEVAARDALRSAATLAIDAVVGGSIPDAILAGVAAVDALAIDDPGERARAVARLDARVALAAMGATWDETATTSEGGERT
jgi:hypothetical protein